MNNSGWHGRSQIFARYGRKTIFASTLSGLIFFSGCSSAPVKPTPPPKIECSQPRTAEIPDWPEDWLADGPSFAIRLLGVIQEERELEAVELACLEGLRAEGVIR